MARRKRDFFGVTFFWKQARRAGLRHALLKPQSNQLLCHDVSFTWYALTGAPGLSARLVWTSLDFADDAQRLCGREIMHIVARRLAATSLVVFASFAAIQARAANVEATSAVDA